MNKLIYMALAASVSGVALAQDAPPPVGAPDAAAATAAPAMPDAPAPPVAPVTSADPTMPDTAMPPAAPGAEMNVPAGGSVKVSPDKAALPALASAPDQASAAVPPCSRTVTDRCIQTSGKAGGRMMRHAPAHRPHTTMHRHKL